ncbi:hypothetical protein N7493_001546 [Penicillium malachiteum]|uniref:Cell surface spherulin 4-like protein n=1 Tax=Penicillium malachiteum TaxID=1324776 RepID=A0AAD6N0F9_9EURO|nr:hypothetical protein N7493_001546 [Penicillium malachiteum]
MGTKSESNVIVPLYVYPSPGAWSQLEDVITTYPNVNFTVIINPGNGPGPDSLPDAKYTRAIPRLSSHSNVKLLGYVHTSYAQRDLFLICRDIETYAAWPIKSCNPNLAVRGIFFDETPQQYDAHHIAYFQKLTQFVKNQNEFGPNPYVIHNPGAVPDSRYFATTDSTVIFEAAYTTFQERYQANLLTEIPHGSQRVAMIHSVPDTLAGSELRDLVQTVRKVADEVFITHLNTDYYASFGPMWAEFVDLMAA